ncbi:hypothetical protein ACFSS8_22065 [Paracoccus kondratievae]
MVKRSPNSDAARYGLALSINAAGLLDEAGAFWDQPGAGLALSLPDGTPLYRRGAMAEIAEVKALGSASQPLRLETSRRIALTQLFPRCAARLSCLRRAGRVLAHWRSCASGGVQDWRWNRPGSARSTRGWPMRRASMRWASWPVV